MKRISFLLLLLMPLYPAHAQILTTIAGNGTASYAGDADAATTAELNYPFGVAVDADGNLYVADVDNNRIRKINSSGIITTVAGNGTAGYTVDGIPATAAELNGPTGLCVDRNGNVYIADNLNNRVRKVDTMGVITTVAGNGTGGYTSDFILATAAELQNPFAVCTDASGNIYIADLGNYRIRKVDTSGIITTIAGNGMVGFFGDGGLATAAELRITKGLTVDASGNIYIADGANARVRRVDTVGIITTIAGGGSVLGDGGPATAAQIDGPAGVALDSAGNMYVVEATDDCIRKISISGIIVTIAGNGTAGYSGDSSCPTTSSELHGPAGITIDKNGNVYFADQGNQRIRKLSIDHAPYFIAGNTQHLSVCEDTIVSVNSLLGVVDSDAGQTETWSVVRAPLHATLVAAYTAVSAGSALSPSGQTYKPATGYLGYDTFKVAVTDCGNLSDTATVYVTVTNCALAVNNSTSITGIELYPNPATTTLTIQSNGVTPGGAEGQITITDLLGQPVFTGNYNSARVQIDVSTLPAGMYFVKVNGSEVRKFVKE